MTQSNTEGGGQQALLTRLDICRLLNISPATFHRYVSRGVLPPPRFCAGRVSRWDIQDVHNLFNTISSK